MLRNAGLIIDICCGLCLCCEGLAYDDIMLRHACVCHNDANHPENPSRLLCIWSRFLETGLHNKCEVLSGGFTYLVLLLFCLLLFLFGHGHQDRHRLCYLFSCVAFLEDFYVSFRYVCDHGTVESKFDCFMLAHFHCGYETCHIVVCH